MSVDFTEIHRSTHQTVGKLYMAPTGVHAIASKMAESRRFWLYGTILA
jgi:hypothetical protein